MAHHFAWPTSSITPVASCPEVTAQVKPAEAQRVSRPATWTRAGTARPATPSRFSPVSTERRCSAQLDARGHRRGCSSGSASLGGSCGSPWGGESSRQAFVGRPHGGQGQSQRPRQCPDRVNDTVFGTKSLVQAEAEVARVAPQKDQCVADVDAAERRLERLQDSVPSAMQQEPVELVLLQSRIDELIRERDSLRFRRIKATSRLQNFPPRR